MPASTRRVADNAPDDEWHAAWARTLMINLQAAADLSRLAVSHFLDRGGGGRIVNVASRAAFRGDQPAALALCGFQGGDGRNDQDDRARLCVEGILCFAVAPGFTVTEMTEEYLAGPRRRADRRRYSARAAWPRPTKSPK